VKKGKQEQYLKDEKAMQQYLTQNALENAELFVNPEAPPVSGTALETLVTDYRTATQLIERMSRTYPKRILDKLLRSKRLTLDMLKERELVEAWVEQLNLMLLEDNSESTGVSFTLSVNEDSERNLHLPRITMRQHGVDTQYDLKFDFFNSATYSTIATITEKLDGLVEEGAYVKRGEKKFMVDQFEDALDWLMKEAQKGQNIQRYKGLGEMNPDQLWDTTMDPEMRRMMKVTIEDAIAADQIFNTLMGDDVEPRRDFIQNNALSVMNLDI